MGTVGYAAGRLSETQQRLVAENVGLVAVHLRRYVRNLSVPRRDREWEDLFQEGCLGLIQAAQAYREQRGIPFAAFALPRIHNAVSRALQSKFATVYVPPKRSGACRAEEPGAAAGGHRERQRPCVHSLSSDVQSRMPDRRHRDPEGCGRETIGERLRGKYERAVHSAAEAVSKRASTRGDRGKLVHILVEERFLVPHEESRRAMRQIARDTRSSYARVAQCDRQIGEIVRRTLQADPEFCELRRRAKSDPQGTDVPVDETIERRLANASADEFARRFCRAGAVERAAMLEALLALTRRDIGEVARADIVRLSSMDRERLVGRAGVSA